MTLQAVGVSHEAAANTAVLLDAAAEHRHGRGAVDELAGAEAPCRGRHVTVGAGEVAEQVAALDGPDGIDLVGRRAICSPTATRTTR